MSSIPVVVTKNELKDLYKKKKMTTYEIASVYDCCQATIWKALVKYKIKRLYNGRRSLIIPKSKLNDLYMKQRLASRKIAKAYGCAYSTIDYKIREYGFPIKTLAAAHITTPRKNFNGNQTEKAYLIGFAMGDLRVRKKWLNSETINIDCGSNKKEQINLISRLFKPYGRVWIKKQPNRKNYIQIECSLNSSFDFLWKKRILMSGWILKNKRYFAAFLAGFTDADGCFSVTNKGLAFYALGNYNSQLLIQIRNQLRKIGIDCPKLTEGKTKGYVSKEGYKHKQNYWLLQINKKSHLLRIFNLIGPHLKHQIKIKDMERAKKNIEFRNRKYGNINMSPLNV